MYIKDPLTWVAIMKVKFTEGVTFTGEALQLVLHKLVPHMRHDVPKLLFLVTDGNYNGFVNPAKPARKIRARGVQIVAVGIGRVSR